MFEQSILGIRPAKRTWPLVASLFAQTTLILLAAIIPLIYTDQLQGLTKWAQKLAYPQQPPAIEVVKEQPLNRPARSEATTFTPPRTIPRGVMDPHESPIELLQPGIVGVVGAGGPPGIADGFTRLFTQVLPIPKPPEPVTPVKPASSGEPIRVSQGVQEAKIVRRIIPVYPPLAITTRTQGTVHLIGIIARDGTIRDLQVIDGHPLLVRAAIDAVRQWIYKPTLLSGEPVEVLAPIEVKFTLSR